MPIEEIVAFETYIYLINTETADPASECNTNYFGVNASKLYLQTSNKYSLHEIDQPQGSFPPEPEHGIVSWAQCSKAVALFLIPLYHTCEV